MHGSYPIDNLGGLASNIPSMSNGMDPLSGYVNPFAQKAQLKKKQVGQKEEVKKHTYSQML